MDALERLETRLVPLALWTGEIELDRFLMFFPKYAVEFLHQLGCDDYTEKDFSVEKFTCSYADGIPYYIAVLHFPFIDDDDEFVGCAARAFVVFSKKLKEIHYFLDIQTRNVDIDGSVYLRRKGRYYERKDDGIFSYFVTERTWASEPFAYQMADYSWAAENKGHAGFLYKKDMDEGLVDIKQ